MIEADDLSLVFPGDRHEEENRILEGLNLEVGAGESVAIIGPSGCGKTSLLYIFAGLRRPTRGRVLVGDEPVVSPRSDIALILQETGLLPWKTVWQNATFGIRLGGLPTLRRVKRALRELGLEGMEHRYPAQLSGGERKRVGLARALAQNAQVILMDEPLAALDTLTREHTQNLILTLWKRYRFTLTLVTHDIDEAVFLGQRVVVLSQRPARIRDIVGNPEMGEKAFRQSEAYFEVVRRIRALLR